MSEERNYTQSHAYPLEVPPKRVVSLVPSITESLFDLSVQHMLVGRTEYCVRPADKVGAIPTVGGTKNPNIDAIVALQPDLVIVNQEENRLEDVQALEQLGISVWITFPKTVQDAFNILWDIMYGFDNTLMLERVRLIEYTFDWLNPIAEEKELSDPVKVFVPIWLDPLMTANGDTYLHDILRVCGGTNIFADRDRLYPLAADLGEREPYAPDDARVVGRDTRYPRVTWNEVVALQPDVILLPNEPFNFTEEHLPIFEALDVPAAKNKRIHLVDGSLLTWHGTRVAFAMNELPRIIRPLG